jgi:hypothetical protein
MWDFRGVGVSPAIFPISTHRKNAGETALPRIARHPLCMASSVTVKS